MCIRAHLRLPIQAFEWVVRDVSRLRDHIETPVVVEERLPIEVDDDDFEVLRESPELADGKFKLEICECGAPLPSMDLSGLNDHVL